MQKMHELDAAIDPETSVLFFTMQNGEKLYTPGRCKVSERDGVADMLRRAGKGEVVGIVDRGTLECLLADITEFESKHGKVEVVGEFQHAMLVAMLAELMIFEREHGIK